MRPHLGVWLSMVVYGIGCTYMAFELCVGVKKLRQKTAKKFDRNENKQRFRLVRDLEKVSQFINTTPNVSNFCINKLHILFIHLPNYASSKKQSRVGAMGVAL